MLTGDGDMLMGLGSLATIGVKQPKNLAIIVLDNAHYGETGMQASPRSRASISSPSRSPAASEQARSVSRIDEARRCPRPAAFRRGPDHWSAPSISAEDTPRVLPLRDGHAIKQRFIAALDADERDRAATL